MIYLRLRFNCKLPRLISSTNLSISHETVDNKSSKSNNYQYCKVIRTQQGVRLLLLSHLTLKTTEIPRVSHGTFNDPCSHRSVQDRALRTRSSILHPIRTQSSFPNFALRFRSAQAKFHIRPLLREQRSRLYSTISSAYLDNLGLCRALSPALFTCIPCSVTVSVDFREIYVIGHRDGITCSSESRDHREFRGAHSQYLSNYVRWLAAALIQLDNRGDVYWNSLAAWSPDRTAPDDAAARRRAGTASRLARR